MKFQSLLNPNIHINIGKMTKKYKHTHEHKHTTTQDVKKRDFFPQGDQGEVS